ncbi:MAG: HAD family hydrolase, partial [Acidobacteriota bacterium]|nr:HAD family hydrolase [Acidobacteriota bacterium]
MQAPNKKTRFDAVVFDLDGTLANTFPTVLRIFNRLMVDRTGREWKLAELAPYFGPPETVMIERIFSDHHNLDNHEAVISDFYRLCHEDGHEIQPFDGIRDLLHSLRDAGVKLGV